MGTQNTYDAIVIGGGLAGLRAARDIGDAGKSVLLLEAQDRLGGRVRYDRFADTDSYVEYGGGWINPRYHELVAGEIDRYSLPIAGNDLEPTAYRWLSQGQIVTGPSPFEVKSFASLESGLYATIEAAKRINPDLPWDEQDLEDLDVSWEAFVKSLVLAPEVEEFFLTWTSGSKAHETNALDVLTWVAVFDNSPWSLYAEGHVNRFVGGTKALVDALAESSGADIRLSTPVARIVHDSQRVTVQVRDGQEFSARTAVFAVPFNVWRDIDFEPGLSAPKQEASSVPHVGRCVKVWAVIENMPEEGIAAWGHGEGVNWLYRYDTTSDGGALHVGFSGGYDLDPSDLSAIEKAARVFEPHAKVVKADAHDWRANEFFKGTWLVHRPGEGRRFHSALAAPEGLVSFAGADVAFGWHGWMEGALSSGARAGKEALKTLSAATIRPS